VSTCLEHLLVIQGWLIAQQKIADQPLLSIFPLFSLPTSVILIIKSLKDQFLDCIRDNKNVQGKNEIKTQQANSKDHQEE